MKNEELDKTDTIKDIEIESVNRECQNITLRLKKNCPKCNRVTIFKNKRSFDRSVALNLICKSCSNRIKIRSRESIEKMRLSKTKPDALILYRSCPSCLKTITYGRVRYRRAADKNNKICFDCTQFRRRLNLEHFRECGNCGIKVKCKRWLVNSRKFCRKCADYRQRGVPLKEETKQKLRIIFINRMVKTGMFPHPSYNENSCNLIDLYGKNQGFNFRHALNGGEFYVAELNKWVDGYDVKLNIVIEVDENHHFDSNGKLKTKDVKRMNEIRKNLKCRFIRIKESDGSVYMDLEPEDGRD
jgi:hypothetical protein